MARPIKQGIDYFPLDTGFLQDIKVRRILRGCGAQSIAIIISLLGNIYKDEGYYIEWTTDMPFLIADEVGVSEGAVISVIEKAIQVEFFNPDMFSRFNILTSSGIQERFFSAISKRKEVKIVRDFLLIEVKDNSNLVFVGNNPIKVSHNEQSKVKESKVKNISCCTSSARARDNNQSDGVDDDLGMNINDPLWIAYTEHINPLPTLTEAQKLESLLMAGAEKDLIIAAIYEAAENNKRAASYVAAIVQNCLKDGIKTIEQFEARKKQWEMEKREKEDKPRRASRGRHQNRGNFKGRDEDYGRVDSLSWLKAGAEVKSE